MEELKKPDFAIELKNFGPIAGGRIELKPLTIFIGPNNSGKSYAAMLINSILGTLGVYSGGLGRTWFVDVSAFRSRFFDMAHSDPQFVRLKERLTKLRNGEDLRVSSDLLSRAIEFLWQGLYEGPVSRDIIRHFQRELKQLVRTGKQRFELIVTQSSYVHKLHSRRGRLAVTSISSPDEPGSELTFTRNDSIAPGSFMEYLWSKESDRTVEFYRPAKTEESRGWFLELMFRVYGSCLQRIGRDMLLGVDYLPAGRSGVVQAYKTFAPLAIRGIPDIAADKGDTLSAPGPLYDFLGFLTGLPAKEGAFARLAEEFEKDSIKGTIRVRETPEFGLADIVYAFGNTEMPIALASSSVTELAPIILYMKYEIDRDSLLIIEEPEAHLHPETQRILAKFLVRLVRGGVRLLITTHSDYLLEQLNHYIMLHKLPSEKRAEQYEGADTFLTPDEVACYAFEYEKRTKGYKVNRVDMDEEEGISEEEFVRIQEALYDEIIKIRRDVDESREDTGA